MSLILTEELARRIEQSEIELLESRLTGVQSIEGNPMGVEIKKFGDAVAYYVKNIPGPSFNNVKGVSANQLDEIDTILDFYHEREIPANFEITPAHCSVELFKLLSERGYFQRGFRTALCASIADDFILSAEQDTSISIREFEDDEFAIFGQIYTKGFNMPSSLIDFVAQNNRVLHHNEHWTFYLARVKGEPAGIGVLFEKDGIATLAASATIPEYRNKGVHSALIAKRLQHAQQNHCHMIVGQTAYGSGSLRNMERAGMKIAYTKAIWTKL
ncbi:GNAT family N-acetyltransferase [Lederbergia sp. NSJ-179]|uniref:GNAT family N-acetyltransferase n=1 Tax=Lederbergia sp. NSJ-179 TaxID=2931402 RepID=UPI001FD45F07|nr:GNAT family N-acetyltransferase [Lederbergia sp. NSJ-179]MCJ7842833.1 GNAT family N-acetyltransferase [Lederbergia sp. NSJ-179]